MDKILEFLKFHYEFAIIGFGIVVLLGAIFDWDWIVRAHSPARNKFFVQIILNNFGETGYRIFISFLGIVLVVCGYMFLYFKK